MNLGIFQKMIVTIIHLLNDGREKNINRPVIAQLNINSVRNKFNFLESEDRYITDI